MVKVSHILLVVGSIGAFILLASSCGGNAWSKSKLSGDITQGLWKSCNSATCVNINDFIDVASWFEACRAFSIISVLAAIGGIVLAILSMVVEKVKGFFASILLICAAGTMALALIIYAAKADTSVMEFAWSYILGWIGVIAAVAAAVHGFFVK